MGLYSHHNKWRTWIIRSHFYKIPVYKSTRSKECLLRPLHLACRQFFPSVDEKDWSVPVHTGGRVAPTHPEILCSKRRLTCAFHYINNWVSWFHQENNAIWTSGFVYPVKMRTDNLSSSYSLFCLTWYVGNIFCYIHLLCLNLSVLCVIDRLNKRERNCMIILLLWLGRCNKGVNYVMLFWKNDWIR